MPKTDYLAFDAFDIKELLNQRLSEGNVFTDQLFEDSNISAMVDVFAYLYDVLTFYVNQGASESIFMDANLYENVNRMVKKLGYNPSGWIPSTVDVIIDRKESADMSIDIPRYTRFDTGMTDRYGNSVYYSTVDDYINHQFINNKTFPIKLYNGIWKKYTSNINSDVVSASDDGASYQASGLQFEQFVLDEIDQLDINNPEFVGHPFVHLYIERDGEIMLNHYDAVSEGTLYGRDDVIFGPTSKVFELRLNENKQYVITFGDGVHGEMLQEGDKLHLYYLETFQDGVIGSKYWNGVDKKPDSIQHKSYGSGGDDDWYRDFLGLNIQKSITENWNEYGYKNEYGASNPVEPESVNSIKRNAPVWFRSGGILNTSDDYENFVHKTFRNNVQSIKVMNNWEYLAEFMHWLYQIDTVKIISADSANNEIELPGKISDYPQYKVNINFQIKNSTGNDGQYTITEVNEQIDSTIVTVEENIEDNTDDGHVTFDYLTQSRLREEHYKFADACDFNNIYIWIKYLNMPLSPASILNIILPKKSQTAEPMVMDSFDRVFIPCLRNNHYDITGWDPEIENYIELRYDNYSKIPQSKVKSQVVNEIIRYFTISNNSLGQVMDFTYLHNKLLAIEGVANIYTVYAPDAPEDYSTARFFNGLSFASWTPKLIEGMDREIVSSVVRLKNFQFPFLLSDEEDLNKRVRLVFESHQLPRVEY